MVMFIRWQYDPVNTKESVLHVCDIPYYTNKWEVKKGEDIKVVFKMCIVLDLDVHLNGCIGISSVLLYEL